jgi:hypothetical protein
MKLRSLAGLISERWREASTCEACGQPFQCGAKLTGCWCAEVRLSEHARAELRGKYRGCLCRQCLEEAAGAARLEP